MSSIFSIVPNFVYNIVDVAASKIGLSSMPSAEQPEHKFENISLNPKSELSTPPSFKKEIVPNKEVISTKEVVVSEKQEKNGHFDCIVLGAGIAGVTAARDLQKAGKKVLLLEGTDRIGGRMYSVNDFVLTNDGSKVREECPVNMGAEFIHVSDGWTSRIVNIINGAKSRPYKEFWDEVRKQGFTHEGFSKAANVQIAYPTKWQKTKAAWRAYISDPAFSKVGSIFSGIYKKIKGFDLKGKDMPAGEFVKSLGFNTEDERATARYMLKAHTPGMLTDGQPVELVPPGTPPGTTKPEKDNISVAGLKSDKVPQQLGDELYENIMKDPDGKHCGYDNLPKSIVKEFLADGGKLILEHEVIKVDELDNNKVLVTTKNSSLEGKPEVKFTTDSLLCSFSAGVLKHKGPSIFGDKFFPEEKRKLFEIIKWGPILKFSVQFKDCVWGNDGKTNDNRMAILANPTKANVLHPNERGLGTFFTAFPDQKNGPYVITSLAMGEDYLALRDKTDEEAAKYIFDILQGIYNPDYKTNPWKMKEKLVYDKDGKPNVLRKDWGADKWSFAGNSYLGYNEGTRIEEVISARENLKSPLKTLPVFWIGEATASAYSSDYQPLSVHGAYISALEGAKDVLNYLDNRWDIDKFKQYYTKKYHIKALSS